MAVDGYKRGKVTLTSLDLLLLIGLAEGRLRDINEKLEEQKDESIPRMIGEDSKAIWEDTLSRLKKASKRIGNPA
jgi:hypothetical protein